MNVGHYGAYIIPAYGLSILVLSALVAESLLRARRWRRAAEAGRRPKDAPAEQ